MKGTMKLIGISLLLLKLFLRTEGFATISSQWNRNQNTPSKLHPVSYQSRQVELTSLGLSTFPVPHETPKNRFKGVQEGLVALIHGLRKNEVTAWRLLFGTFFSSLVLFRNQIDSKLALLWSYLLNSSSLAARIFRTDSYEWVLAVSAFLVYIHFYWFADRAVRKAAEEGKHHPWRKFRLQDRFEADLRRRRVSGKSTESSESASKNAKHTPWNKKAWMFELWVYVLPLLTWDMLSPRRHRRLAAFAAPKTLTVLRDISCGLLLYDALFFTGHFLMHKIPLLYRTVHKKHHEVAEVRAGDVVRLSLVEEVLEVGFSIVALNLLGAHPIARSIYNCIIVFLLTELHCGFDFPWSPQNVTPFGLATGSRRHHYHHRFNKHYYQKFFFTFDRLFGFFQKDDGTAQGDSVKANSYIPPAWK